MDDQFLDERRRFMLTPAKHFVDGLTQSCQSLISGFSEGISGLVLQPIEEAKKDGVIGLFKGTRKGLAGLIIKPIAVVLDATAKTAGISKSAKYLDDQEINLRSRIPRVFYDKCSYFKEYSELDSLVQQMLNKHDLPNIVLIGNYQTDCLPNLSLVICQQGIFLIDIISTQILYKITPDNLIGCSLLQNKLVIQTNQGNITVVLSPRLYPRTSRKLYQIQCLLKNREKQLNEAF